MYMAALPATLAATAAIDVARRRPFTLTRFAAAVGVNLSMHVAAFGGVFAAFLAGGRWAGSEPLRERDFEQMLQVLWAQATWSASTKLYGMDLSVDEAECIAPGPVLILPRHASLVDTLLPLVIAGPKRVRLRYVMKRELLWDPILDALGHRWPTAFVRRGAHDPRELQHVARLLDDLGHHDGIVLFPEGTRFSTSKRNRIIERLRNQPARLARAQRLRHVLPPHPGGIRALLRSNRDLDVVFLAHTGLEGANHFADLMSGTLIGSHIRARLWRVTRSHIPDDPDDQLEWLQDQWEKVDDWIDEHRA